MTTDEIITIKIFTAKYIVEHDGNCDGDTTICKHCICSSPALQMLTGTHSCVASYYTVENEDLYKDDAACDSSIRASRMCIATRYLNGIAKYPNKFINHLL